MKTIYKNIILLLAVTTVFAGCEKDPDPVSTVVDVSYPTVELKGPEFVYIPIGGTFTDEGAILTDDVSGAQSDITATSSEVDPTTPGLYAVTYEAANANGFLASATRNVLVLDYTPAPGLTVSLAGPWLREATGVEAIWHEMQPGLYIISYAGGVSSTPVYAIQTSDNVVDIPAQTTIGGLALEGIDETLEFSETDTTITYKLIAQGFGAGDRTFVKQ